MNLEGKALLSVLLLPLTPSHWQPNLPEQPGLGAVLGLPQHQP